MITIQKLFLRNMIVAIFVATGLLYLLWICTEYTAFTTESQRMKNQYMETRRDTLKQQVAMVLDYIEDMGAQTESQFKETIENRVEEAHAIATNIYEKNKELRSDPEIKK